jgi:FKBP-type peptidyl-prolyl cis-trans isomerases 2
MKISDEKMVSLTYVLTVNDENGGKEVMETVNADKPLQFMFGMGMMLPEFEKNLEGLKVGDKFSFTLSPEQAYGEHIAEQLAELPKNIFEVDGKFDSEMVHEDATIPMMTNTGQRVMGTVLEVKDDVVVMDFNHPLAGETLNFEGEILEVREATAEDIAQMNQEMDGCSCDSCGDEGCNSGSNEGGCGCGC